MTADPNETNPPGAKRPRLSGDDRAAIAWLAGWFGIPFLVLMGLYYAEPLFRRDRVDVVDTVTRQEVHPYPFHDGGPSTSLAPPAIPRAPRPPAPTAPAPVETQVSSAEIVATPIDQPRPAYPRRALEAEREGSVRLRITIAPDGTVADATVVTAHPTGWFESAAVNAVKRWRYRPSGRMISTEVEIEFKLS
ncbi:MAG: energy transducer TonB [Micropepsaceae bacterium]